MPSSAEYEAAAYAALCNIALLRVGHRNLLVNVDTDTTEEALLCRTLFPIVRDATLEAYWWRFATRRATLAVVVGAEFDGWTYAYTLPTDFLAPRYISIGGSASLEQTEDQRIPFTLDANQITGAPVLLTDQPDAEFFYTYAATATLLFTPLFRDALAWRLASELVLALPVKPSLYPVMMQRYRAAIAAAAAADRGKAQSGEQAESELIRVRR